MCVDLSKWAKDEKIGVSYISVHQKGTSHEEEEDPLFEQSVCFPSLFLSQPNWPMNKLAMAASSVRVLLL